MNSQKSGETSDISSNCFTVKCCKIKSTTLGHQKSSGFREFSMMNKTAMIRPPSTVMCSDKVTILFTLFTCCDLLFIAISPGKKKINFSKDEASFRTDGGYSESVRKISKVQL